MKLVSFRVTNYRNIIDSGDIRVSHLTALVGQNEGGKSNLCEALYRLMPFDDQAKYDINEDWPADRWGDRNNDAIVCTATLEETDPSQINDLFSAAGNNALRPPSVTITASRGYKNQLHLGFGV